MWAGHKFNPRPSKYQLITWYRYETKNLPEDCTRSFYFSSLTSLIAQHKFYVNLNDCGDDLFKVTLFPEKLTDKNKIYQFAATAPGTYQIMDIGRYVKSFKAFDKSGVEIPASNISTNQWEISNPLNYKANME